MIASIKAKVTMEITTIHHPKILLRTKTEQIQTILAIKLATTLTKLLNHSKNATSVVYSLRFIRWQRNCNWYK